MMWLGIYIFGYILKSQLPSLQKNNRIAFIARLSGLARLLAAGLSWSAPLLVTHTGRPPAQSGGAAASLPWAPTQVFKPRFIPHG